MELVCSVAASVVLQGGFSSPVDSIDVFCAGRPLVLWSIRSRSVVSDILLYGRNWSIQSGLCGANHPDATGRFNQGLCGVAGHPSVPGSRQSGCSRLLLADDAVLILSSKEDVMHPAFTLIYQF